MQSVFFFCCAPLGAATFRRGQSKKKTPPRVFFFLLRPRGKAREGEAPLEAGTGPEQKKTPPRVLFFFDFFFLLWPRAGAQRGFFFPCLSRGRSKKKHPGCLFFFALAPCRLPTVLLLPLPFAGAAAKKKTPWVVFFFALAPCRLPTGLLLPLPFAGAAAKKTPWVVFFFCCGPSRTLTHSLRAWVAMPPPRRGGVFFFCCGPARTGVVFFFLLWPRPDAHSLTVGWGDFGKARVVFVFLLRPRRVFLDNSKKCLGYYIGSKKTWRGHSFPCLSPGPEQKKKHPGWCFFFGSGPVPASNGASPSLAFRRGRSKKKTPWVVFFFFAAAPRGRSLTHCGPGWRCLPLAGAVFSFLLRRGGIFFFCCGPARTLTHSRWAGAISARPGWCFFFCCGPAGSF